MSCDDHEVDCDEVLGKVYDFLDRELHDTVLTYADIEDHLKACGHCLSTYDLERVVREVLAKACRGEAAPETLRLRVLARIRETRTLATDT